MKKTERIVPNISPDLLSYQDCREQILFHATNLNNDDTSTIITAGRITSIRACLDLLEQYNSTFDGI